MQRQSRTLNQIGANIQLGKAFIGSFWVFVYSNKVALLGLLTMLCSDRFAGVAQLVEHKLPKLGVVGSNPISRSKVMVVQGFSRNAKAF